MADHIELGRRGEEQVAAYLQEQGWEILHRRWRDPASGGLRTDIDLVARSRDGVCHFVEVKTRSRDAASGDYRPERAVDAGKMQRMLEAVERYVQVEQIEGETVVDLAVVVPVSQGKTVVRYYSDMVR